MLLLVGVWGILDYLACPACYRDLPWGPSVALLLIAGTVPIGFVCSVAMNAWLWFRVEHPSRLVVGWIDEPGLNRLATQAAVRNRFTLPPENVADRQATSARVDAALHLIASDDARAGALERGRSLLDLMNGLGNAAVACAASFPVMIAALVTSSISEWGEDLSGGRLIALVVGSGFAFLAGWLFLNAQRRVARVATGYLGVLLQQ